MKWLAPIEAARDAVAPNPQRPAMQMLLDTPDLRTVVFRLSPGQEVPPHRSTATVMLTVLEGAGQLSGEGEDGPVVRHATTGDCVAYAPQELHGMRADGERFVVLAAITPRPGSR